MNGYNINEEALKEEFIKRRTEIISRMLDNPGECGIYPTTKCFQELDALFDEIVGQLVRRNN